MRPNAYRRHHRQRVIRKRLGIIRNVWGITPGDYPHRQLDQPGRLAKDHLSNCSCYMCSPYRRERKKRRAESNHTVNREILLWAWADGVHGHEVLENGQIGCEIE